MRRREFVRLGAGGLAVRALAVPPRFGDARDWFFRKRFGLFIHWGLYAIPAWHEQHMYRLGWTREQYEPLMKQFNPARFSPDAWLDAARSTGMEYLCLTAKHIDGFCLWDTRETKFNVMNTPYGKDIVRQVAEACHRRGVPLELYYSVVDGNNPNYPNAGRAHELKGPQPGDQPDLRKYIEFVKRQIRELCTNYGELHGIWWDANRTGYRDTSIGDTIRRLQPRAILNDRGFDDGDYGTPERDYDTSVNKAVAFDKRVEACESIGYQSWGYSKDEDYYTPEYLIGSVHRIMAKGGNYLLNVGPMADGQFPREATELLGQIGGWYGKVKESLLDVEPGPLLSGAPKLVTTRRGNLLYVHLLTPPETGSVFLHPLEETPEEAVLLNTGQRLQCDVASLPRLFNQNPPRCLRLRGLPAGASGEAGWVVRLRLKPGA
jgi:alpha-L-fucosidase